MTKKTKIAIGAIALVALAGAIFGGIVYAKNTRKNIEAEYQKQFDEVISIASFRQQFGNTPVIQGRQILDKVDAIYWSENETLHAAIMIGGVWLEVPQQFVQVQK